MHIFHFELCKIRVPANDNAGLVCLSFVLQRTIMSRKWSKAIMHVLQQVHPGGRILPGVAQTLNNFLEVIGDELVKGVANKNEGKIVKLKTFCLDLEPVIADLLGGELAQHANSEIKKALTKQGEKAWRIRKFATILLDSLLD
jgi:hypothetical protein